MATINLMTAVGRIGALAGGLVVTAAVAVGLGGSMRAAPPEPDPVTCIPTCEIDGRSLVSAGDDNTTLSAQEITLGLSFTQSAGPAGNFELYDGDRDPTNWDVSFNCGNGCPGTGALAPQLIVELFADPEGIGGSGVPVATWNPGAPIAGTEMGAFPTANNDWAGVTFTHDPAALNGTDYLYAVHIRPQLPETDKGWNAYKIRAAGTTILLGLQVVGFIGAMNVPNDLTTIYPNYPSLTPTVYDGTWVFKTRLPAFLGHVTVLDGDMDFGAPNCAYTDSDDADSVGMPAFALGSAAVAEGISVATGNTPCAAPGNGVRTGTPAEDSSGAAFRRVPSIIPNGIAYQLKAPGSPANPNGQVFLNQNPSGNKEWEEFRIQLVDDAGDIPNGACPVGGYLEDIGKGYPASDCRTTDLPGGVWEIQLDGMDLSNLNFWFFSFKVEPIDNEYSIGRLVWNDANQNGLQDLCAGVPCAPELGIANVAYTVYDGPLPGGNAVRTGFTDVNGEFAETELPAANYTVVLDAGNFAAGQPLNGRSSTTGGEFEDGIAVGLPMCVDTNNPVGCGQPGYAEAVFGYVQSATCLLGPIGGIDLGLLTNYLFLFENGTKDANWEGPSPGFVGNVLVNGTAKERTSGVVPFAGTVYTTDNELDAWQAIVDDNPGQAAVNTNNLLLLTVQRAVLLAGFTAINVLPPTSGFTNRSAISLNNLDTTNGVPETRVINIRSGFTVSTKINITGDPGDVFILKWDTDANFLNGYQGTVTFQDGGAIVPLGGLTAANFIHVAGAIASSGLGSAPPPPYPQGPRFGNGTSNLIAGGQNFSGGGFFTGYWLTTGSASLINGVFVGGWYTISDKFSMSGTGGVYVCPTNPASIR